jgi:hypothetical protein
LIAGSSGLCGNEPGIAQHVTDSRSEEGTHALQGSFGSFIGFFVALALGSRACKSYASAIALSELAIAAAACAYCLHHVIPFHLSLGARRLEKIRNSRIGSNRAYFRTRREKRIMVGRRDCCQMVHKDCYFAYLSCHLEPS